MGSVIAFSPIRQARRSRGQYSLVKDPTFLAVKTQEEFRAAVMNESGPTAVVLERVITPEFQKAVNNTASKICGYQILRFQDRAPNMALIDSESICSQVLRAQLEEWAALYRETTGISEVAVALRKDFRPDEHGHPYPVFVCVVDVIDSNRSVEVGTTLYDQNAKPFSMHLGDLLYIGVERLHAGKRVSPLRRGLTIIIEPTTEYITKIPQFQRHYFDNS